MTSQRHQPDSLQWQTTIFFSLLAFRMVNTYFVQTFFQPDEYFQSLEPAWEIAFGPQSGAWITWEWRERLRTSVHPHLFAVAYKVTEWLCQLLQANDRTRAEALLAAPRLLQAFSAASMDQLIWRVASTIYGAGHANPYAALALTVFSPWQWFCSIRTFSNSLEATGTAAALYLFPWAWFLGTEKAAKSSKRGAGVSNKTRTQPAPDGLFPALISAAVAFYFRPTNIIIWIAISATLVWQNRSFQKARTLVQAAIMTGTTVVVAFASADRTYYGEWAFPPIQFLYFNVVQSLAVFYGVNRIDYYFTEGLPLLLTTALPFALVGLWQGLRSRRPVGTPAEHLEQRIRSVLAVTVTTTILALSSIAHKEVRFIYPLLPILLVLAAKPAASFFTPFTKKKARLPLLVFGIASSFFIAYYVSIVHQRGVIDVMHYLRHRQEAWFETVAASNSSTPVIANISVAFLMPCHSTPWRSHFIYPEINAWALTCEPPLNLSLEARTSYLDEADVFYADPLEWLDRNMEDRKSISVSVNPGQIQEEEMKDNGRRKWPHYLVFFEQLQPTISRVLEGSRYKECRRFFNTQWHDDGRRKGGVVVWCLRH